MKKKLFTLILCMLLGLFLNACLGDKFYGVEGTIYEWVNAPEGAISEIYYQEWNDGGFRGQEVPEDRTLIPIPNVPLNFSIKRENKSDIKYEPIISDENGHFHFFTSGPPTKDRIIISVKVSLENYFKVEREFADNGRSHQLNVVLVRE